MTAGSQFLRAHSGEELLERLGQTIESIPAAPTIDKGVFQASYYGGTIEETDDFLVGDGLFYLTLPDGTEAVVPGLYGGALSDAVGV
jgi:hypothetical protein